MPKLARLINRQWFREVCKKYGRKVGDIVFVFTNDQTIISLNNEFNMKDCATDVMTFRYREEGVTNGEVFISLDSVRDNAGRAGVPIMRELDRVMVRGILDLCGVRSRTSEEQVAMTKAGICAAKSAIKDLKENPQKFCDKYYNIKNQKNEEQL
jgi:rRNA maturation RNase YbeY